MMREYLLRSSIIGEITRQLRVFLKNKYKFEEWHLSTMNEKEYAADLVCQMNKFLDEKGFGHYPLVEVGCGLADILANLKWKHGRIGYDLSQNAISGAKVLHPRIKFEQGSFADIKIGNICCVIMVNFIHSISPAIMKEDIAMLLDNNEIQMFVIDVLERTKYSEYLYEHNGTFLFENKYTLLKRSEPYRAAHGAIRYIEYWERV